MGFQAHWDKARDIDEDKFDSMHLQKENAALAQGVTAHQLRGDRHEFDVRPRDCGTDGRKASLTITKYCIAVMWRSFRLKSRLPTLRAVTSPMRRPQIAATRNMTLNGYGAALMTRAAVFASKKNGSSFGFSSARNSMSCRLTSGMK